MTWLNQILIGDVREVFKPIPDKSIHTIITSPPYWQMRYYDSPPTIWDGRKTCEHTWQNKAQKLSRDPAQKRFRHKLEFLKCIKCGAMYGELGLEPTPELYIQHMLEIGEELWRILRNDGTLWLNMGDCCVGSGQDQGHKPDDWNLNLQHKNAGHILDKSRPVPDGMKKKDLVGMPWMLALAFRSAGWYLRQGIIWEKPNAAPESVQDRPTTSHEYFFLLTKAERYYYDGIPIREKDKPDGRKRTIRGKTNRYEGEKLNQFQDNSHERWTGTRNKRSVWNIPTASFKEAHFATFPAELVRIPLLASTSEYGCCPDCGQQWIRIIEPTESYKKYLGESYIGGRNKIQNMIRGKSNISTEKGYSLSADYITLGFRPECNCYDNLYRSEFPQAKSSRKKYQRSVSGNWFERTKKRPGKDGWKRKPCIVADPFAGSGTVPEVAIRSGRHYVAADINPNYEPIQEKRLLKHKSQRTLL